MEQILYSKWEQGGVPIKISGDFDRFEVLRPGKTPKVLTSKRQVMLDLYGGRDLHIPFDRYFKLGRYARPARGTPALSIEEVFEFLSRADLKLEPDSEIVVDPGRPKKLRGGRSGVGRVESSQVVIGPEPVLGIDLTRRGVEVAKLMYKGFGGEIQRAGYDPDDVLQEIYRGILSRNKGTCPYDPRKSSFSHYVYMVCRCVIKNIHRIEARRKGREFIGIRVVSQTEGVQQGDVAESERLEGEKPEDEGSQEVIDDFRRWLRSQPKGRSSVGRLASEILPLMYHGYTIKEMAQVRDVHPHQVSKAVKFLRSLKNNWLN